MITAQDLADTLNDLGIDSKEKLVAFLAPAKISTDIRQKEAELEKKEDAFREASATVANEHQTEIQNLRSELEALQAQFKAVS